MNDDQLSPGERCASTSNRNFEGRQGAGGRTHLVSPAMAAAAAIAGHFVDVGIQSTIKRDCDEASGLDSILLAVLCLSGCNTMQGLGKDVEKAGEADTAVYEVTWKNS